LGEDGIGELIIFNAAKFRLALQLQFLADSESMGNHDSEPDDWWRID
jgi:hypothetical protein